MALKTRKPDPHGKVPWPFILLGGEEKAGKSYAAAQFCASEKVGRRFWLDLNEGAADEYAPLSLRDGEPYEIIEHDGTFREIRSQVEEVAKIAVAAEKAGEPPVVLVIDSLSALWKMFTAWANSRAERLKPNQAKLKADPDAIIEVPYYVWNEPNKRHRAFIDLLMHTPMIVVATARLAEKIEIGKPGTRQAGKPTGDTFWKIEVQKDVPYDANVVIHVHRDPRRFMLAGVRSLRLAGPNGEPVTIGENLDIEDLVFNRLGCQVGNSSAHVMPSLVASKAERWLDEVAQTPDKEGLRQVWTMAIEDLGKDSPDFEEVAAAITAKSAFLDEQAAKEKPQEPTAETPQDRLRAAAARQKDEQKAEVSA